MASAARSVSCAALGPMETAVTSDAIFFSFMRTASSTAISQKGLMLIFTLAMSTAAGRSGGGGTGGVCVSRVCCVLPTARLP